MYRLSSNLTLFVKMFIPILWTTIFGLFSIAMFFSDGQTMFYKIGFSVFFVFFFILIYFSLWQLKRVETDDDFLYVTNYFKTVKTGIGNVSKVSTIPLVFTTLVTFTLTEKSSMGKKVRFIAKNSNFDTFTTTHAEYLHGL